MYLLSVYNKKRGLVNSQEKNIRFILYEVLKINQQHIGTFHQFG
jgi:hypothetical protein